jgi:hypothetical protein
MPRGSCLCGDVAFELMGTLTSIELCHCDKCKKAYGAPFAASLYGKKTGFRWLRGEEQVASYDAPQEDSPPAYRHSFCRRCGSPLPLVWSALPIVEVPVASLDACPSPTPAYQMFGCQRLGWIVETQDLPWYERAAPLREKVVQALL